jgi:microcystin-dependent protein
MYGGNGTTTFALPDLRGRVPIAFGNGPGLTPYVQGEVGGAESVTLLQQQMPAHTHGVNANASKGNQASPIGHYPASDAAGVTAEYSAAQNGQMNAAMIAPTGGNQPHENRQPYLALNWIVALQGIFPSRS